MVKTIERVGGEYDFDRKMHLELRDNIAEIINYVLSFNIQGVENGIKDLRMRQCGLPMLQIIYPELGENVLNYTKADDNISRAEWLEAIHRSCIMLSEKERIISKKQKFAA